jgi:hypothetical protein
MSCCAKANIQVMDYERDGKVITNRHCLACGSHEHDGKQYTRAQWDAYVSDVR